MKFSHNWLQTFFSQTLPAPEVLAEKITFHSSEIEEIISLPQDTILDVKVLPDKSAWLMSHRGLAKDISVILDIPLSNDQFLRSYEVKSSDKISVKIESEACSYYAAALIKDIKIKPSPNWLKEAIEAVGQRSINNIVDATNYVMFELGQPLHAFDADKLELSDNEYNIGVRQASAGEKIVTLTGETYELSPQDTLIIDGSNNLPIGIAGIKGGKLASIDEATTNILIESANFNRVAIRNTAKNIRLQTDASKRFENGISKAVAPIALSRVVEIILEIAGGEYSGQISAGESLVTRQPVACSVKKLNSVLGLSLNQKEVDAILNRFGYEFKWEGDEFIVIPSFERDDIIIAEDLIEEIGRIHGLGHIVSVPPNKQSVVEFNKRHYYAEKIRTCLIELGFSEIYTSSFRNSDIVKLENALASDKQFLRSTLTSNLKEAVLRNVSNRDLLGLFAVKLFEIGTVFDAKSEEFRVALGVLSGTTYKAKVDDGLINEAMMAITNTLKVTPQLIFNQEGIVEFSLDALLSELPAPTKYEEFDKGAVAKYQAFSVYPAMTRDIAMWVNEDTEANQIIKVIEESAGDLLYRVTLFDEFSKDNKTSFAFRLVFQSSEKTLTDDEVQVYMDNVYKCVEKQGWEVR